MMNIDALKSWKLQPDKVEFTNPKWHSGMEKLVETVIGPLGYNGVAMQCKFSELLVLGERDHSIKHQDAEKEDGMVATLMIQLPSLYEGGDLVVYHGGQVKHRHDFGKAEGTSAYLPHYAVFFADAEDELEKVTKGYRLALIYSISLPPTMLYLERDCNKPVSEDLACAINSLEPDDTSFALLLAHKYTPEIIEELGSEALKDIDVARFHAQAEANTFVPTDKKLEFLIVHLTHQINYDGNSSTSITWYSTSGENIGHRGRSTENFNFLNPTLKTLSEMWIAPSQSIEERCLGYRGGRKATTNSRYAIVAWPTVRHAVNALKFMPLEIAVEALLPKRPIDAPALREFWDADYDKINMENEHVRYSYKLSKNEISVRFCRAYCELLMEAGDLTLVNEFFTLLPSPGRFRSERGSCSILHTNFT